MPLLLKGKLRILDANADPEDGALVYVYEAGTTTPVTTYSDDAQLTSQAHPIVADANGYIADPYVPAGDYKVVAKTSGGATLWTLDDIPVADYTITAYMETLLDDANATAAQTTLGLGTMATQDATSIAVTGGTLTGVTATVSAGGSFSAYGLTLTDDADAATARGTLGLDTDDDVQFADITAVDVTPSGNVTATGNVSGANFTASGTLGVTGAATLSSTLAVSSTSTFSDAVTISAASPSITVQDSDGTEQTVILSKDGANAYLLLRNNTASGALYIQGWDVSNGPSGDYGDYLYIGSQGNVGIGTTTPTGNKLSVDGTLRIAPTTVGDLPSASGVGAGSKAYVTDANATTFNSVVAAGGSNSVTVTSDGSNWRIG